MLEVKVIKFPNIIIREMLQSESLKRREGKIWKIMKYFLRENFLGVNLPTVIEVERQILGKPELCQNWKQKTGKYFWESPLVLQDSAVNKIENGKVGQALERFLQELFWNFSCIRRIKSKFLFV